MIDKLGVSDIVALLRPLYVFAAMLASGLLLFLPSSVVGLPGSMRPWIAIVFVGSVTLLTAQGIAETIKYIRAKRKAKAELENATREAAEAEVAAKRANEAKREKRLAYLSKLTPSEKEILAGFLSMESKTRELNINDGVVTGLMSHSILYQASAIIHQNIFISHTAWFGQVNISQWAWDHLIENPQLLQNEP
jgi:hypothetical protein